ncbi:putative targeting protein for Xklp2 [Monocercomonoides exilis]|uniref:putative targeting protein for Xklp2 n=1 Tax=Monocercomonoides exilis TaxID=2049356 RepID=UPI003559EE49|nr:putative targeting protein for Xklp2 [Monocercomonoides exilis]|eukprot:MONOS_15234.1-p1 / transcript=MONOS_15234.1 / gene=MONOS_15234 / organism=Monocercomonoides_exilis_PA203 / gene_product=unspecified product / transcript_product=unspecified product / location=Mono_scaffold01174:10286-11937(-) / protein_length=442 / sequence_SO=supercontig / SO=protein_coding / is_pseudo=false
MSHLTTPISPNLQTKYRVKPTMYPTPEERENQLLQEMKQYQFKARPFNAKLFSSKGSIGVPKPLKREPIVARTPEFVRRLREKNKEHQQKLDITPPREFHALKFNPAIFQAPVGIPEPVHLPPTIPQPFHFRTETRATIAQKEIDEAMQKKIQMEQEANHFRAMPMPSYPQPIQPQKTEKKIEVRPFHLLTEERFRKEDNSEAKIGSQESILSQTSKKKTLQTESPSSRRSSNASISQGITIPEPFTLLIEKRCDSHLERELETLREAEEEERKRHSFRAQPASVLEKPPFIPQPSNRPLTEPIDTATHSDRRAEEREAFNERVRQQAAEMELKKMEEEEARIKKEEEEEKQWRKKVSFHAQPIKASFDQPDFVPQPSTKPLTEAKSPMLLTKLRAEGKTRVTIVEEKDDSEMENISENFDFETTSMKAEDSNNSSSVQMED